MPSGHPERVERLHRVLSHLADCGISESYPWRHAPAAQPADILRAHTQKHIDSLTGLQPNDSETTVPVDPDTWMSQASLSAATHAAGAVCSGVDDLLSGTTKRVFCAVRPPGHHAEHDQAMGFCLLNSIAIGALRALASPAVERVAILDFDVHHGNGTVDIFQDNPAVLVCSSFQHPHYPNRKHDVKRKHIVHTPLPAGTNGSEFRRRIEADWLDAIAQHKPQLILVSAGFDAHQADPLADINLQADDFAWITQFIVTAANEYSEGRVLSTLEGGYDLTALAQSVESHLEALCG